MKHRKLVLIAILFVLAILTTNAIAGIKDNKVFKYLKGLSDDTTALTAMLILTTILTQYISWYGADLILANPAVAGPNASPAIANAVNSFLYLLIPFYIIAFLITGIYFLFSQSPEGRAKSKSMFFKLIISMGAVFIALPLFQLLLDISQGIAQSIFSIGGDYVNIGAVFSATSALATTIAALFMPLPSGKLIAFLFLLFIVLTLIVIILILVMRYLLVVLAAIVFPFTLVLWLFEFPYEKELGAKLMHHTIVWIFTPVITATVIVLTSVIAGGFYSQCGSLLSSAVSGIGGTGGYFLGGYGGAALGAGLPLLADSDCWLSFFAGIAATFLILAAPLMMYGLMAWVGAGILFFGWTSMAVPLTTAAGGFGPVGLRYFGFPGADVLLRIPGAEEFLDKVAGLRTLKGQDGGILGMTTAVKGYYAGEMPLGAPLIFKGVGTSRIARMLRIPDKEAMGTMPLYGPLATGRSPPLTDKVNAALYGRGLREGETSWEARFFAHSKEEGYRFWRPETVIPKLGPSAVVAAGGVLAGMGPLGIVTAGLKGLWYEPGAPFPLEGEIPLADGSKMLTLAPKSLGREFTPEGLILAKAPNLCRECYPEEYNILVNTPKGHQRLADAMGVGVDKVPGKLAAMNAPGGSPHAPMPPPSTDAGEQLAAEKKRKEAEERIMKEFEKNREMIEKERLLERVKMEKGPEAGKVKGLDEIDKKYDTQLRRAEIGRDKKLLEREPIRRRAEIERQMPEKIAEKEKKDLDEFGSKYPEEGEYVKKRKERIDKEVERIRTSYKEHPAAAEVRKTAALMTGVHWGAFAQTARILARQANLMHGLKNLKVYTPTPPKVLDWVRRRWESEEQKKRQ